MTRSKLFLLGSLYFSQGLPYGFFTLAVPVLLRQQGVSLAWVGASSLLLLPWAAKVVWAPWIDRFGNRRRWILALQSAAVVLFAALAFADPKLGTWALGAGMLAASVLASTQDVATDGLATTVLDPEERGLGNGVQVAAYRVGMIVGGGGLLVLFAQGGWRASFLAMAVLLAVATVPVALARPRAATHEASASFASLIGAVTQPGMASWLATLAAIKAGEAAAAAMVRPWLVDLGWHLDELGWHLGVGGSAFGLIGALVGGLAAQHHRRRALIATGVLQALAVGLLALAAAQGGVRIALAAVWFEHLASGTATAALFTSMMDRCRPGLESTDYTLQASWMVVAAGGAASLSGVSATVLGYGGHFALCAGLSLGAVALLRVVPIPEPVAQEPRQALR